MTGFTPREKLNEVEREIALRRRVYPRFIANGKLTQAAADKHLAVLEAVAVDYRGWAHMDEIRAEAAEGQGKLI